MSNNVSNPYTLQSVPSNKDIHFACQAHAAYYQQVTISLNGQTVVFQGSGEGVPMQTTAGQLTATINSGSATSLQVTFQYSRNGAKGPFTLARVQAPTVTPGPVALVQITSEDSTDKDDNDSYLSIYWLTT
ncbi:MAG: hypothetical protein HZA32_07125 [Opitutae bacterium]|nr:hypothetical protein [Opitutae bacterium]